MPKKPIRLPEVLSREEVERLIQGADNQLHRVCILTLYATGMRREELVAKEQHPEVAALKQVDGDHRRSTPLPDQ